MKECECPQSLVNISSVTWHPQNSRMLRWDSFWDLDRDSSLCNLFISRNADHTQQIPVNCWGCSHIPPFNDCFLVCYTRQSEFWVWLWDCFFLPAFGIIYTFIRRSWEGWRDFKMATQTLLAQSFSVKTYLHNYPEVLCIPWTFFHELEKKLNCIFPGNEWRGYKQHQSKCVCGLFLKHCKDFFYFSFLFYFFMESSQLYSC